MFIFAGHLLGYFVGDIVITSELTAIDYLLSVFPACALEVHINNEE